MTLNLAGVGGCWREVQVIPFQVVLLGVLASTLLCSSDKRRRLESSSLAEHRLSSGGGGGTVHVCVHTERYRKTDTK